jgi:hypothetical protein
MNNQVLINNLRKTVKLINENSLRFIPGDSPKSFFIHPNFDITNNQIISPHSSTFSIYALKMALRGVLLGANYLIAADLLKNQKLLAPSLLSYYTTCFQLLHSYLALNGHVIIDPVYPVFSAKSKDFDISTIHAIFSAKNSKWTFNKIKRDHEGRWYKLKQIFIKDEDVPLCFKNLFSSWYGDLIKEDIPLYEKIDAKMQGRKIGTPFNIHDKIDEFLSRISETRHISVYESFGGDPEIVDLIQNGDWFSETGIDYQVNNFRRFSYEFYTLCILELKHLINRMRFHKQTRKYLWALVNSPYFDSPKIELIEPESLRSDLNLINNWFLNNRQKKL